MEDHYTAQSSDPLGINSLDSRNDGGFLEHSGIDSCFDVTMSSGLDWTMNDAPPLDAEAAYDQHFLTPPPFADLPEPGNGPASDEDAQILAETVQLPLSEDESTLERTSGMPVAFNELPLSDDLCDDLFSREFDPHWITAYNVNPAVLQTFTSPKKLENLTSHDVLKVGDQLAIIESWTYPNQEAQVDRVKTATILSYNVKTQYRPTIRIELDGVFQENLTKCHGPSFIVQAFNKINLGESTAPKKAWKELQVYRGGVWVESLHYVRNSFHLWEEERKAWEHRLEGTEPKATKGKCKWNRRQ